MFLDFCAKVRRDDPLILPAPGEPIRIGSLSEKEDIELGDALLENKSFTYLQLRTEKYTKCSAEAMAKYVRTSKRLQRIRWPIFMTIDDREFQHRGWFSLVTTHAGSEDSATTSQHEIPWMFRQMGCVLAELERDHRRRRR
jgi:hypothetical protein